MAEDDFTTQSEFLAFVLTICSNSNCREATRMV